MVVGNLTMTFASSSDLEAPGSRIGQVGLTTVSSSVLCVSFFALSASWPICGFTGSPDGSGSVDWEMQGAGGEETDDGLMLSDTLGST